jgi:hypothetical protein
MPSALRYQLPRTGSFALTIFLENWFDVNCGVDEATHYNDGVELRVRHRRGTGAIDHVLTHSTTQCWIDPGF